MLLRATQTLGGPVVVQTDQVVYLRQITPETTGVVLGARGFNEFAISIDCPFDQVVQQLPTHTFVEGRQTHGGPVAVNNRHIRYVRGEDKASVFVLGARGGEEFAISIDMPLSEFVEWSAA